ncbi:MAG: hypothetical protein HQ554_06540 [FCB group bacterium]|nr:hypothetical protein [Candidatus Neomarinimicrobiota bacterium]NQT65820.1 hypothetical protein [FCB group bacterium]
MKTISILTFLILLFSQCNENPTSTNTDEYILASYNKSKIESMAKSLENDASLINIFSDDVNLDGKSISWYHKYYSYSSDLRYYFHTTYKETFLDSSISGSIIGSTYITHDWFDSDKAIEIAERNGGKVFREENPEYILEASLSEPLVPNTSTFWYIKYRSKKNDSKSILFGIDANTGEVTLKYPE